MEKIKKSPLRTLTARLRELWPEIEQQLADGVRQSDIVEALREVGIDISLPVFRSYLNRHRKKNKFQNIPSNNGPRLPALPTRIGGAAQSQKPTLQPDTVQPLPEFPETMSSRERRKALASHYVPEEGYPLSRRNKGV